MNHIHTVLLIWSQFILTFLFFIGDSFPHAQPGENPVSTLLPSGKDKPSDVNEAAADGRPNRKRTRMLKELESLKEDNAGKSERDRMTIWRKMQNIISRNDDIANEYV